MVFPHLLNIPPRNEIDSRIPGLEEVGILMQLGYLLSAEMGSQAGG